MILNLPTEVILTIASYLQLQEKVDLVMTCRSLHNLISKTNLYQELDLLRTSVNINITPSIVQTFETHQLDGTQVKTLNIDFDKLSKQHGGYRNKGPADLLAKWKDTLKQCNLKDAINSSLTDMENFTFPRLTELELGYSKFSSYENRGFNPRLFLSITNSIPSLKMLCLQKCNINLEFLEGLHANCIHLQLLILKEVMIVIDNEYLLESITPARSVLKLEMSDDSLVLDTNMSYLDYIVKKYVNLQSLYVSICTDENETTIQSMISDYCSEISVMDRVLGGYTDAQAEERKTKISLLVSDIKSTLQNYRISGGPDFLSRLPKSINVLKLDAGIFNNVMQPLSLSVPNLVRLDVIKNRRSSQSIFQEPSDIAYLQKLQHLKTLNTPLYSQVQHSDQAIASISITKFHIQMTEGTLYLGWILEKLPSLKELYINAESCVIKGILDGKENMNETHLRLRYLKMKNDSIQQELITLVKKVAPNMKDLELVLCGLTKRDIRMTDLTSWKLDKCSISFDNRSSKSNNIICIITIGNVTKRLVFESDYDYYTLLPEHHGPRGFSGRPKYPPLLNLSCDTIQDLKIEGYMIMTYGKYITVI